MVRPSWTETWARVAQVMAERSRCSRAKIGAVIVSPQQRVVATGYNGPPASWRPPGGHLSGSCVEWCPRSGSLGAELAGDYGDCPANHAEINALMHSERSEREGGTIYVTGSVCMACAKAVANSGIAIVVLVNQDREADAHRKPDDVEKFLQQSLVRVRRVDV